MTDPSDPRFGEGETPFLHPPDEMDDDHRRNGLICFLNPGRPCGADCMAYTAFTTEPPTTELGEQSRNCTLLVNLERVGIHSVIAVSMLSKMMKAGKIKEADAARLQNQPPPNPMGP